MTSKGNASEGIKKFAGLVQSLEIQKKLNDLLKVISALKTCRKKLEVLESEEGITVLSRIEPSYQTQLIESIEEIFHEEVGQAKYILEDIDCKLSELQTVLENVNQKLDDDCRKNISPCVVVLASYEDCRSILTFLKLKTNILRNYLSIPFDEPTDSDPFAHFSDFSTEEENFTYFVSKVVALNELESLKT